MRNRILLVFSILFCLFLAGCGSKDTLENEEIGEICISLMDETLRGRIKSLAITYFVDGEATGTLAVQNANGAPLEGECMFALEKEDFPKEAQLDSFEMKLTVTETTGHAEDVCCVSFPLVLGQRISFNLERTDECYSMWHDTTPGVAWTNAPTESNR